MRFAAQWILVLSLVGCDESPPESFATDAAVTVCPEFVDYATSDCSAPSRENVLGSDDDGDGVSEEKGDCDDRDPLVHPLAQEVCDLGDNDCDGELDEGCADLGPCPVSYAEMHCCGVQGTIAGRFEWQPDDVGIAMLVRNSATGARRRAVTCAGVGEDEVRFRLVDPAFVAVGVSYELHIVWGEPQNLRWAPSDCKKTLAGVVTVDSETAAACVELP